METLWSYVLCVGGWISDNFLTFTQMLASIVTAVATYFLWRVTRVLAVETRTLAKMTAQPCVVCWFESSEAHPLGLNFIIINTGNATAFDIVLELTPALPNGPDEKSPGEGSATTLEVSLLPPGKERSVEGAHVDNIHDTVFEATVSWATHPGHKHREAHKYSFKPIDGFRGGFRSKGIHQVAEALEKISVGLSKT